MGKRKYYPILRQRFGCLVVVDTTPIRGDHGSLLYSCRCDCGKTLAVVGYQLFTGHRTSCGCGNGRAVKRRRYPSGLYQSPLYKIWAGIKQRCTNPSHAAFKNYGGRGIAICEEWSRSFLAFHEWATTNGWKPHLSIDRIDNNGPYAPNNCRFADRQTQVLNSRHVRWITAFGETKPLTHWLKDSRAKIHDHSSLIHRLDKLHWPPEKAIGEPPWR